ncbi:MAG: hypothetical protein KDK97_09925 [Verrucomicrobiales bacterium]|nr:hypothetical protein [Verrucomicrobiales bacterium]MCP5560725.1 hypothetical protein [Verrucomicrobiaceae bacterium]
MHNTSSRLPAESAQTLKQLLTQRLNVIGDHALRESNPQEQLRQLQSVSEQLQQFHTEHRAMLPQRLNHFLTQASYQKALEWLEDDAS